MDRRRKNLPTPKPYEVEYGNAFCKSRRAAEQSMRESVIRIEQQNPHGYWTVTPRIVLGPIAGLPAYRTVGWYGIFVRHR